MGSLASDVFTSIDVRDVPRSGWTLPELDLSGGALPAAQHHVQGAHGGRAGGGGTQHLVTE